MPGEDDIQIQKLFAYDPVYSRSFIDIYIGGSLTREHSYQKLIIIVEAPKGKYDYRNSIDAIIHRTVQSFETSKHLTPEAILESALESLNLLLPSLGHSKNALLEDINLLVGLSDRGQIHFSQIGTIQALLIQDMTISVISEKRGAINPLKIFSHITSGLLDPGNSVIFTTPSLLDYVSEEKIRTILLEFPPAIAVSKLELLVSQVPPSVPFASVIVKFTTELDQLSLQRASDAPAPVTMRKQTLEQEQHDDLADTFARVPRRQSRQRTRRPQFSFALVFGFLKLFSRNALNYFVVLGTVFARSLSIVVAFFQALAYKERREKIESGFITWNRSLRDTLFAHLKALPRFNRRLLMAILVVCYVLIHLVLLQSHEQQVRRVVDTYNETLLLVGDKKKAVDNAILIKDEKNAEQLLIQIGQLLSGITPQNKKQEDQIRGYIEENDRDLNKIRHINYIKSPFVYADLSGSADPHFNAIVFNADGSVTVNGSQGIYRYASGAFTTITTPSAMADFMMGSGSATYTLTRGGNFSVLDTNALKQITLNRHRDNTSIDTATMYTNNLYLLDRASGALFKHEGNATTFKAGTIWLKNPELLTTANNFTIDGDVYVMGATGAISKLFRGTLQQFSYPVFNPAIGSRARIYTTKDSIYLYMLDPDNKRIIILDKQGSIKDQFTSPAFNELIELAVNPQENSVAVLNGKILYLLAVTK